MKKFFLIFCILFTNSITNDFLLAVQSFFPQNKQISDPILKELILVRRSDQILAAAWDRN